MINNHIFTRIVVVVVFQIDNALISLNPITVRQC